MKLFSVIFISFFSLTIYGRSSFDHSLFDQLLKKYVKNGFVDYKSFKSDSKLNEYLNQLASADIKRFNENEQLAFWINAYNAYTIKLIVDKYPVKSIKDIGFPLISSPWDREFASVAGKKYTLNNIEHDIIRKNFNEPRIHFALVCAALSCPPLRSEAYTGIRLNEQLENQTTVFFSDISKNKIDRANKTISVSKILDWYKSDFEKTGNYNENVWLLFPKELRPDEPVKNYEIKYIDYNWDLNGK